jgi:DNA-binding MarR family transcriptional regulator
MGKKQKQNGLIWMLHCVRRVNHEVFRILRKRIKKLTTVKLTIEEFVLIYALSRKEQLVIQENLAEAMGKDKLLVLRLINSLEEKELIFRVECVDDNRKNYLVLNNKGEKILEQYLEIEDRLISELVQDFTDMDAKNLYEVILKITGNAQKL